MFEHIHNPDELATQYAQAQIENVETHSLGQKTRTVCLLLTTLTVNVVLIGGLILAAVKL